MTFLFCKWLIATNIVTRRRRISDSEEEIAPRQATELPREAVMSPRGKEAAESSRKGKEPARSVGSEEEFDSEETETSEEAGETSSSSDKRAGLPDSFFERGLVRPSVAPTQSQATSRKRGERVVMTYPNRMTVDVLSGDEEDEEDEVPLARRQRSRPSTQAQTQIPPRTELRTKRRHEGSETHPLKKQKKAVSKPRVHLPALEETSVHSASLGEQGSQEEGEYRVEAASPGCMETEETSFVQQMQDALEEGPADAAPTPNVDTSATDAFKLKEVGASNEALESAPTNEDVPMHEPIEGEATHATKVDDFNNFDFNISEDDHQQILDSLLEKASDATIGSDVGIGSTEAGPSERPTAGADTTIITGTSDRPEESTLKEPLSLDPPSSEALIEKASDVAGASTATIPESTLVVPESKLPSLGEPRHAESSSVEPGML
ncbi:uncharacterized protein LOC109845755 [Asparagus officinalis]|uniref:uncharacterized protein LOC109845755 n=1 Tax=Asparagus officinalis TaxID=4686 RepID=UPI00098DE6F5|nr:uncharacterized protein LOC109845755 [Asparagus officinalis]